MTIFRPAVVILLAIFLLTPSAEAQTDRGLTRDGRWFTYNSEPIYLVGFDRQELASDPQLDYVEVLDQYALNRINKVRIWLYNWWGGPALLAPWRYDAAIGKYNLDEWDVAYWKRLKDFIAAAEARNVIVEISLFADYSYHADRWSSSTYRYAWNGDYNINGAFSTNKNGGFFPEFFDLNYRERSTSGKTVRDYQQAIVDKTLAEVGSFPNIYFEIANEFPGDSDPLGLIDLVYPWQQYWARYVSERSSRPVNVHAQESSGPQTLGVQHFWDEEYIDALGFHFYSWDPLQISTLLHDVQSKGKVITNNESFHPGNAPAGLSYYDFANGETRFAWAIFTSGGYFGHEDYGPDDTAMNGAYNRFIATGEWKEGTRRLRSLRDIAESVNFWELSPIDANNNEYDALVTAGPSGTNWQVLCKPGSEYVVYFWGSNTGADVHIEIPPGNYAYSWYDVRNATIIGEGAVTSTGSAAISSPRNPWDAQAGAALVIKRDQFPLITSDKADYCVGDTWQLRGRGTAANSAVQLLGTSNGESWIVPDWKIADSNGSFATTGSFDSNAAGTHTLRMATGRVLSNKISLTVSNCKR